VLVSPEGRAKLCDFGASFFYSINALHSFERTEVQAFGLLVRDLSVRVAGGEFERVNKTKAKLDKIVELTCQPNVAARPSFAQLVEMMT
jgi:hypothetical protein